MEHKLKVLPAYFEASDGSLINPEQVRRVEVSNPITPYVVRFSFDGWGINVFFENTDGVKKEMKNFTKFLESNSSCNELDENIIF